MGRHTPSPIAQARDELFQHVIRCRVLDASMQDRLAWMDQTIDYLAERYPGLTQIQLAQLGVIGRRFVKPAIPHGADSTAINRSEWQN